MLHARRAWLPKVRLVLRHCCFLITSSVSFLVRSSCFFCANQLLSVSELRARIEAPPVRCKTFILQSPAVAPRQSRHQLCMLDMLASHECDHIGIMHHTEILCGHLAAGHTSSWRFGLFPFSFEVSGLGRCHHLPEEMRTDRFFSIRSISRCRQTVSNAEAPCPEIQPRDRYFLFASEAWKVLTMKHRGGSNTCEEKCGQRSEKRLCECIQASEAGLCTTSVIKLWQTRFSIMEMPRFPCERINYLRRHLHMVQLAN